jgi:hypothetical protein
MSDTASVPNDVDTFKRYWAGKGRLGTAFWGYGYVASFVLAFLAMLFSLFILPFALRDHSSVLESPLFRGYMLAVSLVLLGYQLIAAVLIWRNAPNSSSALLGNLAKAFVLLNAFSLLVFASRVI